MTPHKVLILGAQGQVGFELQRAFACQGELLTPSRHALDLTDAAAVERYLNATQPDLVLNAAAYTAVDKAEQDADVAAQLNTQLPALLADYVGARQGQARLVHYSTDYVYHSDAQGALTESSPCLPQSVYGRSKLAGEQAIQQVAAAHSYIFRISWVYAQRRHNFVRTMLRLAQQHQQLSIVDDQYGAPIAASLVADVTLQALCCNLEAGIYNLTCSGTTHWKAFAELLFSQAAELGLIESIPVVQGVTTQAYTAGKSMAPRPLNSVMSVELLQTKMRAAGQAGWQLPMWQDSLRTVLQSMRDSAL